jgi:hypothetical protein
VPNDPQNPAIIYQKYVILTEISGIFDEFIYKKPMIQNIFAIMQKLFVVISIRTIEDDQLNNFMVIFNLKIKDG